MHRLFVALRPPSTIREACHEMMVDGPAGWAWQDDDQLHLTIRYIGEVERPIAEDIATAIQSLRSPAIDLRLAGAGWFDHGPRGALYVKAAPKEPLLALHEKVDRLLVRCGLGPERRAFHPHITLARRRRAAEDPTAWLASHAADTSAADRCDYLTLYESHLGKDGSTYEPILRVPLAD